MEKVKKKVKFSLVLSVVFKTYIVCILVYSIFTEDIKHIIIFGILFIMQTIIFTHDYIATKRTK